MKYLKKFATHSDYVAYINGSKVAYPNVSICEEQYESHLNDVGEIIDPDAPIDWSKKPLTFEVTSPGNIVWKAQNTAYTTTIEYKKNDGEWTSITSATGNTAPSISVVSGDVVQFRGDNATYSRSNSRCNYFSGTTCGFNVKGNIMSLINSTDFATETTLTSAYTFYYLFYSCTGLTDASNLILPATTLAPYCYQNMFQSCTSLTTVPELPTTTLAQGCYQYMFNGCTSLTTGPELPASALTLGCYQYMFQGCTSLTTAPELPATTLASQCYYNMFSGCTSLTTAPELPATALTQDCYNNMFNGCTSLTIAPALPATTLQYRCYYQMFQGCTGLTTAPELPATALTQYCYYGMFQGCTSLTTAPELPATTLAPNCYQRMFFNCTGLTQAPVLPATTLEYNCYQQMFYGCSSLNYIKCLAQYDSDSYDFTNNWVYGVANSGTFVKHPDMNNWSIGNNGIPTNWVIDDYSPYKETQLTFSIISAGTINWVASDTSYTTTIEYSTDSGNTWTSITSNTGASAPSINVNAGDKVLFRGDNAAYAQGNPSLALNYNSFVSTAKFNAEGNIMSLIDSTVFIFNKTLESGVTFANLFAGSTNLISAEHLIMPAKTLQSYCYYGMFSGCTSLTTAPELPATTAEIGCYNSMFDGCSSLRTAPALPATTLANNCYQGMFQGCTSLTTAPALPATTLATGCYSNMFAGCTGLSAAPDLMVMTLADSCYYEMFKNCTNLNEIKCMATDISATNCTTNWVSGVAASGTFYKIPNMTGWTIGVNGIPTNWTVEDVDPYQFEPFTIEVVSGSGSFYVWSQGDDSDYLYYSINGDAWVTVEYGQDIYVESGDIIQFKGTNQASDNLSSDSCGPISENSSEDDFRYIVYGNIMSLVQTTGFENMTSLPRNDMAFYQFFGGHYGYSRCPGLVSAEHLVLPLTALTSSCCAYMFIGCTNLIAAPKLPATTLADGCYDNMFSYCTSLTTAPELPATTLASQCYDSMFYGCSSLNYIKCLATDISAYDCTDGWVSGVASTGTFVKNANADWSVKTPGYDGIPTNWTVQNAS